MSIESTHRVSWRRVAAAMSGTLALMLVAGCGSSDDDRVVPSPGEAAVVLSPDDIDTQFDGNLDIPDDWQLVSAALSPREDSSPEGDIWLRVASRGGGAQILDFDGDLGPSGPSDSASGGFIVTPDESVWAFGLGHPTLADTDREVVAGVYRQRQDAAALLYEVPLNAQLIVADVALSSSGAVLAITRPYDYSVPLHSRRHGAYLEPAREDPEEFRDEPTEPIDVELLAMPLEGDEEAEVVAGQGRGCATETVPADEAQFSELRGVDVDDEGVIYLADAVCGQVYELAPDDSVGGELMVRPLLEDGRFEPVDVIAQGGEVYFLDWATDQVHRLPGAADRESVAEPEVFLQGAEDGTAQPDDDNAVDRDDVRLTNTRSLAPIGEEHILVVEQDRLLMVSTLDEQ